MSKPSDVEAILMMSEALTEADDVNLADIPQINTFHIYRKFGFGVHKYGFKIFLERGGNENIPVTFSKGSESDLYPVFENEYVYGRLKAFPVIDVDESVLYLPKKLESFKMSGIPTNYQEKIALEIFYKEEILLSDQVAFFNDFFEALWFCFNNSVMRYYHEAKTRIDLLDYWLSSSLGVVTEVSEFKVDETKQQTDLLLKSDMSSRVATQNHMDELFKLFLCFKDDFVQIIKAYFVGSVVKVIYGDTSKEYMIADIDGKRNPNSNVWERDDLNYVEYFAQEHNIQIKDRDQPLMIHIEYSPELRRYVVTELIPELCRLSKIALNGVLVDVDVEKPLPPIIRYQKLMKFFDLIYRDKDSSSTLADWGLSIERSVHTVLSDNLPLAWSHLLRGSLLDPVPLHKNWLMVYYGKDRWVVDGFLRTCQKFAEMMSIKLSEPRRYAVNRQDTDTFLSAVRDNLSEEDRIVVVVTPGGLQIKERYDAIKQFCTEVRGIPTQFVRSVTLDQPRKMETICANILVQMNCKAGGVPWSVEMPLESAMYVGLDVYKGFHCEADGRNSTMGFVASTNAQGTRWFSKVAEQPWNGICDENLGWAMKDALYQYKAYNRALPSSIVIYRKEGNIMWTKIVRQEWPILERVIQEVYKKDAITSKANNEQQGENIPYVVLMSVARRISPGFSFEDGGSNAFDYDDTEPITNKQVLEALNMRSSKKRDDPEESISDVSGDYISAGEDFGQFDYESFFLCTQNYELSCMSPVRIRVLHQSGTPTGLKEPDPEGGPDSRVLSCKFLQTISVKLCYLYYNIPAVCYQPSPILYSQKLAFFAGNHLKQEASENLESVLYFL